MPDLTRAKVEWIVENCNTEEWSRDMVEDALIELAEDWFTMEAELQRWRNWKPDDDAMRMSQKQAEQADYRLKAPVMRDVHALEARVRELEDACARLTKINQDQTIMLLKRYEENQRLIRLTHMQDEFITEKSSLAAERLMEINRLAFELHALNDGREEETQP